jgi:hypothetical protein
MLKVWTSSQKFLRVATQFRVSSSGVFPTDWITKHDPLLRYFVNGFNYVFDLDPVLETVFFGDSLSNDATLLEVSRQPVNSKVKDNLLYDEQHYGSFLDSIQGFWSILHGDLSLDPPSMMFNQHYVRH